MTVTPRGLAAALLVVVVAGACMRLGIWQLDRLQERRQENSALAAAQALPPLDLQGERIEAVLRDASAFVNRRVRVRGTYETSGEVVLRGRSQGGRPGVHLVAQLRIEDSPFTVLVNRGWVPSPDAFSVDPRPLSVPGEVVVEGILLPFSPSPAGALPSTFEVDGGAVLTLQRLEQETLQGRSPRPLLPAVVQQLPDSGRVSDAPPHPVPLPAVSEGSHLSYAVQWFSFAAIAVFGFLGVVARRSLSGR